MAFFYVNTEVKLREYTENTYFIYWLLPKSLIIFYHQSLNTTSHLLLIACALSL
ncbi:hypothetical protein M23134_06975 [Microscilla marina ATCC 23134]|uniref:Uncharacterized protein n=1 Tax=Microscilla marina ATCC 23134 TaxID=313606 RepID=A1ZYI8_MICM2|nr:hypothetical protein M23134_06975 [Microscilla marina ATCC 23134]